MQITEKVRHNTLLSLPSLPVKAAEEIATTCGVSTDTVYRYHRQLRNGTLDFKNEAVITAILELAVKALPKSKELAKRKQRSLAVLSQ